MMSAGLRLIPLDPGRKSTHEKGWADKPGERTLKSLINRVAAYRNVEPDAVDGELSKGTDECPYNFGVHNESSRVMVIDVDDPQAERLLRKALKIAKPDAPKAEIDAVLTGGLAWRSAKGVKRLYRWPRNMPDALKRTSAVIRRDADDKRHTVFELRCTGQDAVPPSYRADVSLRLAWLAEPTEVPEIPDALLALHRTLLDPASRELRRTLEIAAGTPAHLAGRNAAHDDEYPGHLRGHDDARRWFNAQAPVTTLMDGHPDYEAQGKRYRYVPSGGSPSISGPRSGTNEQFWQCWDSDCPVFGQFDAWRFYVEHVHQGDVDAAAQAVAALRGEVEPPSAETPSVETPSVEIPDRVSLPVAGLGTTDYVGRQWRPRAQLLDGGVVLTEGCTLLIAPPKAGKTTLLMSIALMLMDPQFCDYGCAPRSTAHNVLILGLDMQATDYLDVLMSRYRVNVPGALPQKFMLVAADGARGLTSGTAAFDAMIYDQAPPSYRQDDMAIEAVVHVCKQHNIDMVLLDNLAWFNIVRSAKLNALGTQEGQMVAVGHIRDTLNAAGISSIVVNYTAKAQRGTLEQQLTDNLSQFNAGMGAMAGGADHLMMPIVIDGVFSDDRDDSGKLGNVTMAVRTQGRGDGATRNTVIDIDRNTAEMRVVPNVTPLDYLRLRELQPVYELLANRYRRAEREGGDDVLNRAALTLTEISTQLGLGVTRQTMAKRLAGVPGIKRIMGRGNVVQQGYALDDPALVAKYATDFTDDDD